MFFFLTCLFVCFCMACRIFYCPSSTHRKTNTGSTALPCLALPPYSYQLCWWKMKIRGRERARLPPAVRSYLFLRHKHNKAVTWLTNFWQKGFSLKRVESKFPQNFFWRFCLTKTYLTAHPRLAFLSITFHILLSLFLLASEHCQIETNLNCVRWLR